MGRSQLSELRALAKENSRLKKIVADLELAKLILNESLDTTQLGIMKLGLLKDLDVAPLPFETDPLDLFLAWHRRDTDNPAHRWLRVRIVMTINSIIRD